MNKNNVSIAVVGSVNVDFVASVKDFPKPGETVTQATLLRCPGGKGANQAVACRRLGADVFMIACLGDDPVAEEAVATMRAEGVDLTYCKKLEGVNTGLAMITVAASGENQIVVAPGANAAFEPQHLELPDTDAIIAQLEVPMETILLAARDNKAFFCLNAAPAKPVPKNVLDHVDLLVVNEIEAEMLKDNLCDYAGLLATTFGSRGAIIQQSGQTLAHSTPPDVEAIDTTGAGDAFTAALTVGLVSGMGYQEALDQACCVGALTTTRRGAQTAPTLHELNINT